MFHVQWSFHNAKIALLKSDFQLQILVQTKGKKLPETRLRFFLYVINVI